MRQHPNNARTIYRLAHNRRNLPPVSIIDFAGLLDETIPYDLNSPETHGEGPHNTVISSWYSYLDQGLAHKVRVNLA